MTYSTVADKPTISASIATVAGTDQYGNNYPAGISGFVPVGSVQMYASQTPLSMTLDTNNNIATCNAPAGWMPCGGAAVSRTTYAALFAVIGTTYGTGDGSTTFNLPNMNGRFPYGSTSPVTGGSTTHSHNLSGNGWAYITASQGGSVQIIRTSVPSWNSGQAGGLNAGTTGAQTWAAGLGGATDNNTTYLPPWTGFNFMIRYI